MPPCASCLVSGRQALQANSTLFSSRRRQSPCPCSFRMLPLVVGMADSALKLPRQKEEIRHPIPTYSVRLQQTRFGRTAGRAHQRGQPNASDMPSPPPPPALAHDYNLWDVVFPKPRAYPGLELIQPSQYNLSGYAPSESFKVKISLKTEDEPVSTFSQTRISLSGGSAGRMYPVLCA